MTSDARAHPRYAMELDAEIRFEGTTIPARSRDVSRGGLCFDTATPIPPGKDVSLNMALVFDEETFSEPLQVRARVVWCTPLGPRFQVGASFVGLTAEARTYLEMFLRYLKEGLARQAEEKGGGDGNDDEEVFG